MTDLDVDTTVDDLRKENQKLAFAMAGLQSKIDRQRTALNTLNKRVRGQRLHLRYVNELGRQLTPEEWADAKAKYPEALEYEELK